MAQRNAGIRFASIAVAAALLLTGCIPGFSGEQAEGDSRLYTGPIPAPAPLPPEPELPPAPAIPVDPTDAAAMDAYLIEYDAYSQAALANQEEIGIHYEAMRALAEVTRSGGEQSVAVWQSLLVAAGIAVAGEDGKPLNIAGNTGFGWAMTDAELRLHSVLATASGGVALVDLADALAAGADVPGPELAQAMLDDLGMIEDVGFSKVLTSIQPELLYEDGQTKAIDEVVLSWGTVGLVLRRLSAELAVSDPAAVEANDDTAGPAIGLISFPSAVQTSTKKRACDITGGHPWAADLLNYFHKGHTLLFDKVIEHLDAATDTKKRTATGRKIGLARLASAMYTMLAKAAALDATFTIDNAPLVRTKNTQSGEVRDLTVSFSFNKVAWDEIRECMNLFLAPFGLDVQGSQEGVAENIDVHLYSDRPSVVRIGDGKGGNTDVTQARTDAAGHAKFRVSGAPQADILPDVAEPEDIDVGLRAVSNLAANDFFKDMESLPWDALDAAGTGGLSAVPLVLSRMKFITQTGTIPVRDWSLNADFEATLVGSFEERWASHTQGPNACTKQWSTSTSSTQVSSSLATDSVLVSAALLSNPRGNLGDQAAVLMPTSGEMISVHSAEGVVMFDMPVHYQTTKHEYVPAVGPLPPERVIGEGGCGDRGPGEWTPPVADCGARQYSGDLQIVMPKPRTLYAVAHDNAAQVSPWNECGSGGPHVAPAAYGCTAKGGKMPPISVLFDSANRVIEVDGSLSCSKLREGFMSELDYQWTLVLCRIVDGKSAC